MQKSKIVVTKIKDKIQITKDLMRLDPITE